MITIMATRIGAGRKPHLYIDEHMAAKGMGDADVADRLDRDRTTIWKWRKKGQKISINELAELAHALDMEDWREFLRPPGEESVDVIVDKAPANVRSAIVDFAKKVGRG